jgi:hypothetical protein
LLLEPARRRAAYHSNLTPIVHARELGARVAAIVAGIVAATMLIVVAGIAMIQRDLTVGPSLLRRLSIQDGWFNRVSEGTTQCELLTT